jgi:CheY-like chemotaxis protein
VRQAMESNAPYAEQFGVSLVLESGLSGIIVNVDSDRLLQALTNLLSNAARYSPRDEKVVISVVKNQNLIRIAITDRGPGIPPEIKDRIFQKFSQINSTTNRKGSGTGLGLWISKALVEGLGGKIGFDSTPNSQTTFFIDLPEWSQEFKESQELSSGQASILICEDEYDVATLLSIMLTQEGFSTDIAYNLNQAKEMLSQKPYQMMTMDLALPDGDGISLIRELRKQDETRGLPIIVVSAKAQQTFRDLGKEAEKYHISDWIDKPIHSAHFLTRVRSALQK